MTIPHFTAEASLHKATTNYHAKAIFDHGSQKARVQALPRLRAPRCPMVCDILFVEGRTFTQCRFECPGSGGGGGGDGGDGSDCKRVCMKMTDSERVCDQMCGL